MASRLQAPSISQGDLLTPHGLRNITAHLRLLRQAGHRASPWQIHMTGIEKLDRLMCWVCRSMAFGPSRLAMLAIPPRWGAFTCFSFRNDADRPVLKHGPRSLTRARVSGWLQTLARSESRVVRTSCGGSWWDWVAPSRGRLTHHQPTWIFLKGSSQSAYVGTRKIVNYG